MGSRKTPTPDLIDKERNVLELRRAGATWDECARVVGYATPQGALLAYRRAISRAMLDSGADEARQTELDRLDRLQRSIWPQAVGGDIQAINTVLRVMDRRAKLLGLDAPIKQQVTVDVVDTSSIDAEVQRLAAMLNDKADA